MNWRPTLDQRSRASVQSSVQLSVKSLLESSVSDRCEMVSVLQLKSQPNRSNKLVNQLFWWQRLRKVKSIDVDAVSNVCVILRSEQSTRTVGQSRSRSVTESFHSQTSVTPAVSFVNRGEGLVSMQLMDRVMINDNQLYSMGLSELALDYSPLKTSHPSCDYLTPFRDSSLTSSHFQWFYGSIDRQNAIKLLNSRPIGSFIVRHSTTDRDCYALTVRVPNEYQISGIAHYLIDITNATFRIKVFQLVKLSHRKPNSPQ